MSEWEEERDFQEQHEAEAVAEQPSGLTRRDFIGAALVAAGTFVGGALLQGVRNESEAEGGNGLELAYDSSDRVTYPDRLSEIVAEGMEGEWEQVALFPGIFTVTPGAKFYRDVMLTEEIDLGIVGDNRGVIQRPVFPGATLSTLVGSQYEGDDLAAVEAGGIDSNTFAFFVPGVEGVVFGNYQQSIESLQLHTRLTGGALAYNSETEANLPLQFIEVDERRELDEAIAPIAVKRRYTDEVYEETDNPDRWVPVDERTVIGLEHHTVFFVIGQGRVYDSATALNGIVYGFVHNRDPITIENDVETVDVSE